MATVNDAYKSIADLNLWFKVRSGDEMMLSDIPILIPLRWNYFKDSWEFIKQGIIDNQASYANPDFLDEQIKDFSKFVEAQRVGNQRINPFSDSYTFNRYYAIFDNIPIEGINLTNEEERLFTQEVNRVKAFSKNNFLDIKRNLVDYRDRIADVYGLGDDAYNAAYNKSSIPPQITATIVEANMLLTIESAIKSTIFVLANLFAVDAAIDPFALARANANNPDIDIGQYKSGKLVRLNYGEDLAGLATRYLGDPNKWIDISIANGLKPPYIDEVGIRIPLLSNASGNQINLSETDVSGQLNIDRLYINQPLFLQSDTEVYPEQRSIVSIKQIPVSGEIILEIDGANDLSKYKTADNAHIRVYLPNTVNSSFFVLIPSSEPLPDDRQDDVPWFLAKSADDEKRAKIDLAIDDSGEINFTTNGDLRLSYGVENAVQAIKLKIVTELGSLRYHPGFGLVNVLGNKNNNIDEVREMLIQSITTQIEADNRFDRIESLSVDYLVSGESNTAVAAMAINLTVRMAGGNKVIPISFTVNNI
jgi:hypothetical protein